MVAALRQLDPSGKEGSFEELVAQLLAKLVRQPVRRAHAGPQEGKDALSDDGGFAIECKRYLASTPLRARELISELEEVRARHRDFQLWVLATTTALGATEKEKLDQAAHSKGLAVLHLDTASAGPYLKDTHAIAALCATDVESTLRFVSGAARKRVRGELEAIRGDSGFAAWVEWLRGEIRDRLPVWRFVTERQNRTLAKRIRETAYPAFGTRYDAELAVRRQACAELDEWFNRAITVQGPELPPLCVVVGERYDGKTWLVYQWLVEIAERSPVPIFFVGSARGLQSDRGLTELQVEDLIPALKKERSYAESFFHNYRGQDAGKTPWALVILDGLNEYAPNHDAWLRHLDAALGRGELDCRPAAVLLTVRARSWPELKELLPRREAPADFARPMRRASALPTVEIPLGPFTEKEFQEALVRLNLPADFLEALPESARVLAHRPRYLELLARYRERSLGDYAAVTPEVLHWLDLCDKVGRMRPRRSDWGSEQYQNFLRDLARRWWAKKFLDEVSVREILGTVTQEVPSVLAELRSEGVLSGASGNYTVQPDRLTLGYGLFLRDALVQASRGGGSLTEALHDLLSPFVDGDEAVDALRAASTLMLVEVAATPPEDLSPESTEVLDVLLWEWLSSRNLGERDLEAIYELRKLLFDSLLRRWRDIWSKAQRDSRIREVAVMVFGEQAELAGAARDRLRAVVQEWFRLVPLEGGWYQNTRIKVELDVEKDDEPAVVERVAALVRSRVEHPSLGHLGLKLVETLDVPGLQASGLYLVSRAPDLVDPADLLALTVVGILLEEPIDSGDFWVIRRATENIPPQWFKAELNRCVRQPNSFLGQGLRELIRVTDRADLVAIKERLSRNVEAEEPPVSWDYWPTRQNYKKLLRRALKSPREVERFAESARKLVCDPSIPRPSREQTLSFAQELKKRLAERSRSGELQGLRDVEDLLPVLAAWAPTFGAKVICELLQSLPTHLKKGRRTLLLELRGHSTLVRGPIRSVLQETLRLSRRRRGDWRAAQRELTLALLPAASLEETVTLLTAKEEKLEHKQTFNLAGALRTSADRRALVDLLKSARSPMQKRRLRLLLACAGGAPLPETEVKALCRTLRKGGDKDIYAALRLAVISKVEDIAPSLLFPISRGQVAAKTIASDDASRLLVDHFDYAQIKDNLDDYWRAESAARRSEDAQAFLDEISGSLAEYKERRGGLGHGWEAYDLPPEIVTHLDLERIAEWTRAVDSWDGAGWRFWGGLIRPVFEWCLRNAAAEQAGILWRHIYPFQRRRFGGGSRLTIDGVDSVLHALNRPESDDALARSFLTDLILDARTDLELFEIALGARFRGAHRLREIAQKLSTDPQAERRARAVAILGWLVEGGERLEALRESDPSLWVREQAEIALQRHASESWASTWLNQFLTSRATIDRWAAGQLFLACADRRIDTWAWKQVKDGKFKPRLKGEAFLLLMAAQDRANKEADKLKPNLLGYTVNELSRVAHPWRRDDEWILAGYGRRD
jgi:hypothetical protein